MKEKSHILYKSTCTITGRFYVGIHSTDDLDDGYLGSGTVIRRSINKYGAENHKREIIQLFENRDALMTAEKNLVSKELLKDPLCMNLMPGGYGGPGFEKSRSEDVKKKVADKLRGQKRSEKTRKKMSESAKLYLKDNPRTPSRHSEETKQKMKKSRNTYFSVHGTSEEARKNISLAMTNMTDVQRMEWIAKISLAKTGKKHSEETKIKMGLSRIGNKNAVGNKGRHHSEETKQKMRLAYQKRISKLSK